MLHRAGFPLGLIILLSPLAAWADDRPYAAELKAAGNSVRLDEAGNLVEITFSKSEKLTDADYEKLGTLTHLTRLTFYGDCLMTDAQAEHVGKLTTLESLAVNGTALSDAGFKPLGKLVNLKHLIFWHLGWKKVAITGKGFAELVPCKKLETFGFAGSAIGDEGLAAVAQVKSLRHLEIGHTRVTDAGLTHLKALPELRSVQADPQFSMRLGDAGLATLATIPKLEMISFGETMLTYDGSLGRLKDLKHLKTLKLLKAEIAPADLAKLKADLPETKIEHSPPEPKMLEQMRSEQLKKK